MIRSEPHREASSPVLGFCVVRMVGVACPCARLGALLVLALAVAPATPLLLGAGGVPRAGGLSSSIRPATHARAAGIVAQEGADMDRQKSRGRTATVARPKPKPKNERREDVSMDKSWRVLLHNDDVRRAQSLAHPSVWDPSTPSTACPHERCQTYNKRCPRHSLQCAGARSPLLLHRTPPCVCRFTPLIT